jgi:protease PrsW
VTATLPPPEPQLPESVMSIDAVNPAELNAATRLPLLAASPAAIERRYATIRAALLVEMGVLATLALALVALELGLIAIDLGSRGVLVVLLGLAPLPLLVAFGLWLDRFEPEPPWLLARTLLWGAGAAILVAGFVNSAVADAFGETAAAVVAAPLGEELLKGIAVWWIYRYRREHLHGIKDGIVYAIFVGVGFTVVEDAGYYADAFGRGTEVLAGTVVIRGMLTPLMHSFFTAFTAMAIARAATVQGRTRRALLVLAGFSVAVFLHALWNSGAGMALYPVLYLPPFLYGLVRLRRHRREQQRMLERGLLPEVTARLLAADTVEQLQQGTTLREFWSALGSTSHPLHARRRAQAAAWSLAAHRAAVVQQVERGTPPRPIDRAIDDELLRSLVRTLNDRQQLSLSGIGAG